MGEATVDDYGGRSVGKRLKNLRTREGSTQSRVAKIIGCSVAHISKVEAGHADLPLPELQKLALYFKVHPLELVAGLSKEVCELADEVSAFSPKRQALV